mgnify:CR=1 FL=1
MATVDAIAPTHAVIPTIFAAHDVGDKLPSAAVEQRCGADATANHLPLALVTAEVFGKRGVRDFHHRSVRDFYQAANEVVIDRGLPSDCPRAHHMMVSCTCTTRESDGDAPSVRQHSQK